MSGPARPSTAGDLAPEPELSGLVARASRLIVISPHLDDAVLGCGDMLATHPGAVVLTAFAGRPPTYPPRTSWDERAGFEPQADVVGVRRMEDERALATLSARPSWLAFPDPQYGSTPSRCALADALTAALQDLAPDVVVAPLGLFHDDHTLTSNAALAVLGQWGRSPSRAWLLYADAIYRALPNQVTARLRHLQGTGFTLHQVRASASPASNLKRRAVACYASQVRALERSWEGGISDAFAPERYWQIAAPVLSETARAAPLGEEHHGNAR